MKNNQSIMRVRKLNNLVNSHKIWDNHLLKSCSNKLLTKEDFKILFSQYYLYSKNFSKLIAIALAKTEEDYFRAKLSINLWEEGGGADIEKRHAEIFRRFLTQSLLIDYKKTSYEDCTQNFVNQYYNLCLGSDPLECAAILAFGTEGIVAKLYTIFKQGLVNIGYSESELEFFNIHIAGDDDHAKTLEEMALSYHEIPYWFERCANVVNKILDIRNSFFNSIYQLIQLNKVKCLIENISSPTSKSLSDTNRKYQLNEITNLVYSNNNIAKKVNFTVNRVPAETEVLDARIVHINPGQTNEMHRHAHETILMILSGEGAVIINDAFIRVSQHSIVHVPRWCYHQTQNTGTADLCFFAVTDYGLTQTIPTNTEQSYREQKITA